MQKVFVGLSGGVDSAVSAALLKERGYDVTGAFIKIWQPEFIECSWQDDRVDAMRVSATLGIPFREIDLSEAYKRDVINDLVGGYARGITPNPDVLCNTKIKFGEFARWAFGEGADYIATGHYARTEVRDEQPILMRGIDGNKDQTYFLWQIRRDMLARTLFPIGSLTKKEVRAHARRFGLPNAAKPDSQGLCFVGDVTMAEFLRRYIPVEQGNVVNERGDVLGVHDGAALFTLGQRHGFTLSRSLVPHYVTAVDVAKNTIMISEDRSRATRKNACMRDVHWIDAGNTIPANALSQVRYRGDMVKTSLTQEKDGLCATFEKAQIVAPGQSLVFYDGERVLGGGIAQ